MANDGCDLDVDGRIGPETAGLAVDAGAKVLVAGSAMFRDTKGITSGIQNGT